MKLTDTPKGAIRNPEAYLAAAMRRRSQRFDHCFPRWITLGDVDSFVEINDHFLLIEWKVVGQEIPTGQWYALTRFAKKPKCSAWVLWTDESGEIKKWRNLCPPVSAACDIDEPGVADHLRSWVATAEAPVVIQGGHAEDRP